MGDIQAGSVSFVIAADPRQFDKDLRAAGNSAEVFAASTEKALKRPLASLESLSRAAGLTGAEVQKLEERMKQSVGAATVSRALDSATKAAGLTSTEIRKLEDSLGLMTRTAENMSKGTVAAFSLVERAARNYSGVLAQLEGQAQTAGETRRMTSALMAVADSADATAVQIFQLAGRMDGLSGTFGDFHGLTTGTKTELAELATALGLTAAEVGRAEAAMGEAARNQALTDSLKRIGAQAGWTTEQLEIYARQLGIVKAAEAEAAAAPVRRAGAETTLGPKQQAPFNLGLDTHGSMTEEAAMNRADAKAWLESAKAAKTAGEQTQAVLVSIMAAEAETSRGALALEASISQMVGASTANLEQLGAAFNIPKEQIESLQAQAAKNIELGIKTDLFKQLAQDANLSKVQIAELETQFGVKLPVAVQKASSHFKEFGDMAKNVFVYGSLYNAIGFLQSIPGEIAKVEGKMEQLHASFRGIFGEEKGEAQFAYVEATAEKYGKSIDTVAESYRKFAATTDYVGVSSEQTKHIFESVTQAITKVGGSSQDVQGTLRALEQMLSTNTVTAVEFRREFAMRIPGAMKMGADALGVTVEKFKELLQAGRVVATDFVPNLADQMDKFSQGWEESSDTIEANSARFHNSILKALDSQGMQNLISGSLKVLSDFATGVGDFFSRIGTFGKSAQMYSSGIMSTHDFFYGLDKEGLEKAIKEYEDGTKTIEDKLVLFRAKEKELKEEVSKDHAGNAGPVIDWESDFNTAEDHLSQLSKLQEAVIPVEKDKWIKDAIAGASAAMEALKKSMLDMGDSGSDGFKKLESEGKNIAVWLTNLTKRPWVFKLETQANTDPLIKTLDLLERIHKNSLLGKLDNASENLAQINNPDIPQDLQNHLDVAKYSVEHGATQKIKDDAKAEVERYSDAIKSYKGELEDAKKTYFDALKNKSKTEVASPVDDLDRHVPGDAYSEQRLAENKEYYKRVAELNARYSDSQGRAIALTQDEYKKEYANLADQHAGFLKKIDDDENKKGQHGALQANAAKGLMDKLQNDSDAIKASLDSDEIGKKLAEINKKYDDTLKNIRDKNIKGQAMDGAKTLAESNRDDAKDLVFGNELDKIFPEKKQAEVTASMKKHFGELAEEAKKAGDDVNILSDYVNVYSKDLAQLASDENAKKITTDFNTYFDKSIDERNIKAKEGGQEERAIQEGVLKDYTDNSDEMYAARARAYDKILEKAKQTGDKELEYTAYQKMDEAAKTALDKRSGYEHDFTASLRDALSLQYGLYKSEYGKQQDLWKDYSSDILKGLQGLEGAFDSTIDSIAGDTALGKMKTWHDYVLEMLASVRKETMAFLADLAKTTLKDKILKPLLSSAIGGEEKDSTSSSPYGLAGSSKAVQAMLPAIQSFALSGLVGGSFGAPSILNAFTRVASGIGVSGGGSPGALITGGNSGEGFGLAGTGLSLALGSGLSGGALGSGFSGLPASPSDLITQYWRANPSTGSGFTGPSDFINGVAALTGQGVDQTTAMYLVSSGMASGEALPSGSNFFTPPTSPSTSGASSQSSIGTDLGYLGKAKSVYDLANGGGSGIVNSINSFGLDTLGIGTDTGVPLSWTLNATQAANYGTWVAEGADPSAAWLGAAQGGGTAVEGGLGSILGAGAVGGAAGGLAGAVLRPDDPTASYVGAGVGLAAGATASALGIGAGSTLAGMLGLSSLGGPIGIAAGLIAATITAAVTPDTTTSTWSQAPGSSPATEVVGGNVAPSAYGVLAQTTSGMFGSSDTTHQVVYQAATDPAQIKSQDDAWKVATQSLYDFGSALGQTRGEVSAENTNFNFPETALPQGMQQSALDKNIATAEAQQELTQTGQLPEMQSLLESGETWTDEMSRLATGMNTVASIAATTGTDFSDLWSSMDKLQQGNFITQLSENVTGGMSSIQTMFQELAQHGPGINQTNEAIQKQQLEQLDLTQTTLQANTAVGALGSSIDSFWTDMQAALSSGTLNNDTVQAWSNAANLVNSMQSLAETLQQTSDATNEANTQLEYSLQARDQQAEGESRAAAVTQLLAQQEKELYDARQQGLTDDQIAQIQQVQGDEMAALQQQQALQLQQTMMGLQDRIAAASGPAAQNQQWLSDWSQKKNTDYQADASNYGSAVADASNQAYDSELKAHLDALEVANQDAEYELGIQTQIDTAKRNLYGWETDALSMLSTEAKAVEQAYAQGMSSDYITQLQAQQQQEMTDYWTTTTEQLNAAAQGISNQYQLDLDTRLGGVNTAFAQLTDDLNLYYEAGGRTAAMQQTIMQLASQSADTLRQLAQSLGDTALSLNQQYNPNANPNAYFQSVYGEFSTAVNQGMGGDQTAIARAQSLSSTVLQAAQAQGSYSTFQQTYAQVQSDLSQLQTVATNTAGSMDTIDDTVGADAIADSNAAAAAAKVAAAQDAYNLLQQQAIEAFNNSMEGEISNALAYTAFGSGTGGWEGLTDDTYGWTNGATVDAYLHANPDQIPEYVAWFQNNDGGMTGSGTYDQWAAITGLEAAGIDPTGGLYAQAQTAYATLQTAQGYSTGGVIPNGTSGVDNTLVFAQKGERVLTPSQTASFDRLVDILDSNSSGSSALVDAAVALKQEISTFRDENKRGIIAVATTNEVVSKWINKWERIGMPPTRPSTTS